MYNFAIGFACCVLLVVTWVIGDMIAQDWIQGYMSSIVPCVLVTSGFLLGKGV
jgi:hypothetical protein